MTVVDIISSISQIKPKAMKSLITDSISPDYTMINTFVISVHKAAENFMKPKKNGNVDRLP